MRVNVRLDEIRDTFEACDRHAMRTIWYVQGDRLPHYPVPAIASPLNMIAAMPCGPVTDFIDIGYYGGHWK